MLEPPLRTSNRVERCQDFFSVAVDLHPEEDLLDDTVLADDECRPFDPHAGFPVHRPLLVDTVGLGDFPFGVGQKRHVELIFLAEIRLLLD